MKLRLGLSTCPNDLCAFHAILNKKIDLQGLEFDFHFSDVQSLNDKLMRNELDYSKASFYAAMKLGDRYGLMRSGNAFGFGVGPVVVARDPRTVPHADSQVLCPGALTSGYLLFRYFYPQAQKIRHQKFFEVVRAIRNREADIGVVIHEGRFTFEDLGLFLLDDFGVSWQNKFNLPIPLGAILGRLDLPIEMHRRFDAVLKQSQDYAHNNPEETMRTMQHYAQELDPEIISSYIKLYVNQLTWDIAEQGIQSLRTFEAIARECGLVESRAKQIQMLS